MGLKAAWRQYYRQYIGTERYFYLSAQAYTIFQKLPDLLRDYCRGTTLDLGCGEMAYRHLIEKYSSKYISLDKCQCHPNIDFLADINDLPFVDGYFDTIFCSTVFEHIPQPWLGIKETARVMKKGAHLILIVPHLCYLHGEPEDYYRYTKYGIAELAATAGLEVVGVTCCGGLLSFLSTPFSILANTIFFRIKPLNRIVELLNRAFVKLISMFDSYFDQNKIYCYNYIAIIKKA